MKKILILLFIILCINSCATLSLDANKNGATFGIGINSKTGNLNWHQDINLNY